MKVSCIGSRASSDAEIALMEMLGARIVEAGHELWSGNAPGADQAYARGANRVRPELVTLCLPSEGFQRHAQHPKNRILIAPSVHQDPELYRIAEEYHGAWERLSAFVRKLMARNIMIVRDSQLCIARLNHDVPWGGGTGHGVRYCRAQSIEVIDLAVKEGLEKVQELTL